MSEFASQFQLIQQLIKLRNYQIESVDTDHLTAQSENGRRIQFFLCGDHKLDMAYFYKAYERLDQNVNHLFFLYSCATIQIKKLKMYKDILRIEFFSVNELQRLLIGNRLIPTHTQVDPHSRDLICQKFGKENLPHLLQTDPIARLHDFDLDAVVEIHRADVIYYRLVVTDD